MDDAQGRHHPLSAGGNAERRGRSHLRRLADDPGDQDRHSGRRNPDLHAGRRKARACSRPAGGRRRRRQGSGATEKTLANGLRVIVANKPGLPLVSASLRIGAGGSIDPSGQGRPRHHDRRSRHARHQERARRPRSRGRSKASAPRIGASAGVDATDVSISSRSDKAADVFTIMADVVQNPAFAQEELDRARQETLDGLMVSLRQPSTVGGYRHDARAVRRRTLWRHADSQVDHGADAGGSLHLPLDLVAA